MQTLFASKFIQIRQIDRSFIAVHFLRLRSAPSALKTAKENSLSHALSLDFQIQADRTS